ncbi:MAG: 4-hydroxy-tetrahydrodipicolinate synthase [Gammaproteobacteria bacterium HGW-Gammaproteobacteria-5]|nr:MAG: 4-hydroxy-tetrahydrodipicolinate synthase [Gammaproteobacteria bacterium HGW-Gammaproteobacteria-5]
MQLQGCITALATPFNAAGALDLDAFARLLDQQLAGGVGGVVVAGSTGEAAALEPEEYDALLRLAVERLAAHMPVLAGTGLSSTAKTIRLSQHVRELGAAAALVVTPAYVRPTQEGLYQHYLAVAENAGLPIVLYNVPSRTGCDLLPETSARLNTHPAIIGIKEAVSTPARITALLPLRQTGFALLSGDDPSCADAITRGADGVISVASNVVPASYTRLCALAASDPGSAASLDSRLGPLYRFLACEPNPTPVKAILAQMGLGTGLRLPLLQLSAAYASQSKDITALCQQLETEAAALTAKTAI